jgi:DNA-binding response OmpR family regulator
MAEILVVEDEPSLRLDLVEFLSMRGHDARGAATAKELRTQLSAKPPRIVILDVGLPDGDGFELAREIRSTLDCGIIMLTALGEADDRIKGFEAGADIYLVKRASLREIEAAAQSLLRRLGGVSRIETHTADLWRIDAEQWRLLSPGDQSVKLTATEYTFLSLVMEQPGQPRSREELIRSIARPVPHWDNRHLDAVVSRLRRKVLKETGHELPVKVIYGNGYAFTAKA